MCSVFICHLAAPYTQNRSTEDDAKTSSRKLLQKKPYRNRKTWNSEIPRIGVFSHITCHLQRSLGGSCRPQPSSLVGSRRMSAVVEIFTPFATLLADHPDPSLSQDSVHWFGWFLGMCNMWHNRTNLFRFTGFSTDWTLPPSSVFDLWITRRLSHRIPTMSRKYHCWKTEILPGSVFARRLSFSWFRTKL